jgi:signal transduction histidine kinase
MAVAEDGTTQSILGCGTRATTPRGLVRRARARLSSLRSLDRGRVAHLSMLAVVLGVLYALGALLPFWFLKSPEAGAAFFPSAGLTLATLVLTPRRTWPLWLSVIVVAEMAVDLTHGQTVGMAIGFALANTVEPLVGAVALLRTYDWHPSPRRVLASYLSTAVVLGPMVGALIGATVAVAFGSATDWAVVFGKWWLGDALGVFVIATPIMAWSRRSPFDAQVRPFETALIVVLATAVTVVPALLWHHPLIFAVLPILMWAALRGGWRAVSAAGVGVAFAADWAAVTGRASELLEPASSDNLQLVYIQFFLAITLVAALMLTVEVADRRRVEQVARSAEVRRIRSEHRAREIAHEERRRVARDTHDIVSHGLNVMLLQAGAARSVLNSDVRLARQLLESLEAAGRNACDDLDVALALGDRSPEAPDAHGVDDIGELVDVMRGAGLEVGLDVEGERGEITSIVDRSAYRIVQEALTNVAKHAPGARTLVGVRFAPDAVFVSVVDDGAGSPARPLNGSQGRGLLGMRERVTVLAGHLEAGPEGEHGFAVRARLPARAGQL